MHGSSSRSCDPGAVRPIAIPEAAEKVVEPLTQEEIQALLKACKYTNPTVHHVHATDVAGVFRAVIRAGSPSYGQSFHAVSTGAATLRGYAKFEAVKESPDWMISNEVVES